MVPKIQNRRLAAGVGLQQADSVHILCWATRLNLSKNKKFHLRRHSSGGNTCWATPCQPSCSPIHHTLIPSLSLFLPPSCSVCLYMTALSPLLLLSHTILQYTLTHPLAHQSTSQLSALILLPPHSPFVSCTQ